VCSEKNIPTYTTETNTYQISLILHRNAKSYILRVSLPQL